jgi:hypothetical protein
MPRPPPPLSGPSWPGHVSEDDLEALAMGKSLGNHAEWVHAHLLACDDCCLRLVREAEFIDALRQAFCDLKK